MTNGDHYENLIVGSGEGGKYLAWHLARLGQRTALIERKMVGGSCPNTNCLPSKNEIWSAKVAYLASHGEQFGTITGPVRVDMARVLARKTAMVDELVEIHHTLFRTSGTELIMGTAQLTGPGAVSVALNSGGERELTADRLFLNLGTHAAIPNVPGLRAAAPLTHVEALELGRLPEHLIVVGGGYVGLELAQAFRRFGSAVTILEAGPRLAAREDEDVGAFLLELLKSEGLEVHLSARLGAVSGRSGDAVTIQLEHPDGNRALSGSDILVAAGRTPNTSGIGLEHAGVETDTRGFISVNDRLETSAPNVWAIGECAGSPQFTHASMDDFRVIRDNLAGRDRSTSDRLMPYCLYTDPPLARVGLSEEEAIRNGLEVRVARIPTASVLRPRTISETRGFLKAVVGADDRILGFTMIGSEAGEVMTVVEMAMMGGLPYTALRDGVVAHPTMAEGLNVLFGSPLAARHVPEAQSSPANRHRPSSGASSTARHVGGDMPGHKNELLVERHSSLAFDLTVKRLSQAVAEAGMQVFAVIDHTMNAMEAGLRMPGSTVLIYGKAAGGTPIMLACPRAALDLPLHVLVREDSDGRTVISFYPIASRLKASGVPSDLAARLEPAQALLLKAIETDG